MVAYPVTLESSVTVVLTTSSVYWILLLLGTTERRLHPVSLWREDEVIAVSTGDRGDCPPVQKGNPCNFADVELGRIDAVSKLVEQGLHRCEIGRSARLASSASI